MSTDTTQPVSDSTTETEESSAVVETSASEAESTKPVAAVEADQDGKTGGKKPKKMKRSLFERVESYIERLSTKSNFWNRVCSMIWLPYAFRSGITMTLDENTYRATLPFRRFNKNWYSAMAGAALLGNSEIAGGNYVFNVCGGDYTVVCKHLEYKFLRPCHGPAEYRMTPLDDIHALVATGKEFNIAVRMDIVQVLVPLSKKKMAQETEKPDGKTTKPKRVGRCTATFHVTPKSQHKAKKLRGTKKA
ncbi:MAG: hypothetical protein ACSHX5_04930 [Phycisphaerales bacterium]